MNESFLVLKSAIKAVWSSGASAFSLSSSSRVAFDFARAFNASAQCGYYQLGPFYVDHLEEPLKAPSVFNFYRPDNGEFQIYTPPAAVSRANLVNGLFSAYNNPIQTYGPGTTIDIINSAASTSTRVKARAAARTTRVVRSEAV